MYGETEVILAFNGKEEKVKLIIKDTTPPEVKFRDVKKYIDYQINADDFIEEKNDLSEMNIGILEAPESTAEYGDYKVKIKVEDIYGNATVGECKLSILWLNPEVYIELGNELKLSDLIMNPEKDEDKIPKDELKKVDTSTIGEYEIKVQYEGQEYVSKIIVRDTTPPELELKDITIYEDEKIPDYKNFIKKVSDASGEPETNLKTEISVGKIGTQEITIEAIDKNENKTEKTATLTIKKDNEGPVMSGLGDKTVAKNSSIDYLSGVKATDARDGNCEVTVESSNVNLGVAGTYYATYSSRDKKGNTTTKKRKIVVKHNQDDTNAKFNEFYNKYLAGKDIVGMAGAIRNQIKYSSNWGGDDPVWYGLTEGRGNCYVHALIMQKALNKAGYSNQLIHRADNGHYWNLVNVGGAWRHIDATPSPRHTLGLLTDDQKWNDAGLDGVGWDKSKWPAAE